MHRERPSVVALAGPNGAGKSTMAGQLLVDVLGVSEFVDADVLARALPRSEAAAVAAGRAMLKRFDELAAGRQTFGFETTLASRSFAPRIRRLIIAGYECHLVFLWLPNADFAVARVADRVRLGGHAVPEEGSSPLSFGPAQLLRPLSTFDDNMADVRQFDTRAAADRLGCRSGDANRE